MNAGAAITFGDAAPDFADAIVHQQIRCVAGMMGNGFDLDDVTWIHLQHGRGVAVDVTPHAGLWRGRQMMFSLGTSDAIGEVEDHVGTLTRRESPQPTGTGASANSQNAAKARGP